MKNMHLVPDSTQRVSKRSTKLTNKQSRFVEEYLIDLNATQAAIRAGYSKKTANVIGPQNLVKLGIAEAIQKAMDARSKRTEITVDRVLKELAKLGFANMLDYMAISSDGLAYVDLSKLTREQAAAIQELNIDQYWEGDGEDVREVKKVKFKLADKKGNLEMIGRHLKMFTDKVEVSGNISLKQIVAEIQADNTRPGIAPPGED